MKPTSSCPGNPLASPCRASRREFLQVGAAAGLGLTLPDLLRLQAAPSLPEVEKFDAIADSVIHIFLPGGIAQHESWDPKPFASADYRGPYAPIKTALTGEYIGEKFPQMAKILDRMTVIRSMTHGEAAHERGTHNMFTGYRPSPAIKFPSFGSIVSHELGSQKSLPPYVVVPNVVNPDQGSGYLSSAFGPFALGSEPSDPNFAVRDLLSPKSINPSRLERRRSLLGIVDDHFRNAEKSDAVAAMDSFYDAAYSLISSQEAREAFDLSKETKELREQYGRNQAGQRLLLARRLVEAGVRMVSVTYGSWDHHSNLKSGFDRQASEFDKAFSRLITDLDSRGMLDRTLVMVTSEFGRTPKINGTNGRDHWPRVFSVALAGGGVKRGYIHGASDSLGSEPERDAVSPEDLAKTMYRLLGINSEKRIMSDGARPIDIVNGGHLIQEILI